jgi:hypothetical protein
MHETVFREAIAVHSSITILRTQHAGPGGFLRDNERRLTFFFVAKQDS